MEDNVQRIFAVLISVLIFFLLPLYMSFEKKDDISYALALKITTNFVENVKSKGYISRDMYNEFVKNLAATDNIYEISLEHIAKKYYPVIYAYDSSNKIKAKYDYNTYKNEYMAGNINGNKNLSLEYELSEQRHDTNQILEVCDRVKPVEYSDIKDMPDNKYQNLNENDIPSIVNMHTIDEKLEDGTVKKTSAYTMNVADQFNVIIKNQNTTMATVLFNVFTLGANSSNTTKVYVNYGATIQNEDYRY